MPERFKGAVCKAAGGSHRQFESDRILQKGMRRNEMKKTISDKEVGEKYAEWHKNASEDEIKRMEEFIYKCMKKNRER